MKYIKTYEADAKFYVNDIVKRKSDNVDIVINESILDDNIVMNTNNNAGVEKSANSNIQNNELQTADDVYKKYGINTNDDNSSKKNKKNT